MSRIDALFGTTLGGAGGLGTRATKPAYHDRMRAFGCVAIALLVLAACSSGPSAADEQLASSICNAQIACGRQLVDAKTCADLYVAVFDSAKLQACNDCVKKEPCASRSACDSRCTVSGNK